MADEKTNQRIVLSRHTLRAYETNGLPGGPVDQAMTMIRDEVAALRGIVAIHPKKAIVIADLVVRWEAVAARLKAKAH